ncbi:hypothetical protein [Burkholderia contaminans]|uniref:hypothetical protein n=1 Tax=Burkholderia contaminans TaxID=488447 RepID=UPI00158258CA|nr:hypothetical protein [Burkholderia contaminans]
MRLLQREPQPDLPDRLEKAACTERGAPLDARPAAVDGRQREFVLEQADPVAAPHRRRHHPVTQPARLVEHENPLVDGAAIGRALPRVADGRHAFEHAATDRLRHAEAEQQRPRVVHPRMEKMRPDMLGPAIERPLRVNFHDRLLPAGGADMMAQPPRRLRYFTTACQALRA